MRHVRNQLYRMSMVQFALILLLVGLFFGILFANFFRTSFEAQLIGYRTKIFSNVTKDSINHAGFFRYVLINNLREFILFWLFCITILGIPYIAYKICSFGFFSGFFISAITMQYGPKGILLVLANALPHGFIYLPVAVMCIYKGFELCTKVSHDNHEHNGGLSDWIRTNIFLLFVLATGLLFGSYLEAYAGAYLLKKTLQCFAFS
jgi:stage II sporulation protein M